MNSKGMVLLLFAAFAEVAGAQPKSVVTFESDGDAVHPINPTPGATMARMNVVLYAKAKPSTPQILEDLRSCLSRPGVVQFMNGWPPAEGLEDLNSDSPPFTAVAAPPVVKYNPEPRIAVTFTGDTPIRFRNTVILDPSGPECAMVEIAPVSTDAKPGAQRISVSAGVDGTSLPPFKGKVQLGAGGHGGSFDFSLSKLLSSGSGTSGRITTIEASGKLPIGKPDDVRATAGAQADASKEVPDALNLSINSAGYSAGGHLDRFGARLRATGSLHGTEVVAYWSPLFGWFGGSRGFYAAEVEGGWRRGDAEFTSLRTHGPDAGHTVARLGAVVEWAPLICLASDKCINGNLSEGLRFFVRGRGWVDMFEDAAGSRKVRTRPFIDSELFYNFSSDSRVFIRGETGYLPPDLSTRSKRVYVGVGQAF